MISDLLSSRAKALSPYTPGEQPRDRRYIKLNTNENPYPPAPGVQKALGDFQAEKLRLYPDPNSTALREALADFYGLSPQEVFVGNGSDEVLSFIFYAFFDRQKGPVLFPEHSYSFYPVYCSYYDLPSRRVPMAEDFSIRPDDFFTEAEYSGIVIPNPNAPTGIALSLREMEAFIDRCPADRLFVVDEAYVDFGAESCSSLLRSYENLVVVHTFSKSRSLAGMRIGFALGNPEIIQTLFTVKDSFNSYPLNRLSQELAVQALRDKAHFDESRKKIIQTREGTVQKMRDLGWQVLPSQANFIFATLPGLPGEKLYRSLKEKGILVRHFAKPGIKDYIRITIGTDEEMSSFISTISSLSL